ncbi:IFT43 [Scenedesmus sp. PABB004]|nr:IFT43 [Scenedesmus sp. PABB004]
MDPPPLAGEEGFSPMRAARPAAGRRAGRHVAIQEPAAAAAAAADQEPGPTQQQALQPQAPLRQLSSQGSQRGGREAAPPGAGPPEQLQQLQSPSQLQSPPPPAPPAKRVGFDLAVAAAGAAGDPDGGALRFTGVSRRKQEQLQREEQVEARQRCKYDDKAVEGVGNIPELEEEGREDVMRAVARAPRGGGPRVQAVAELEADRGWLPSRRATDDDIDLSLLTARLLPSEQVAEPPEVWDHDLLLSALKAELQLAAGGAGAAAPADGDELRQI